MPSSEKSTPREDAVHASQHSRPRTTTRNTAGAHRTKARVRGDMSGNLSDEANHRSGGCRILSGHGATAARGLVLAGVESNATVAGNLLLTARVVADMGVC